MELPHPEHWTKSTTDQMELYRSRWRTAVRSNDSKSMGALLIELWDRLVMQPDAPELRLGLAHVGLEFIVAMKVSKELAGQELQEQWESLGAVFWEIKNGERATFNTKNAAGEKRLLVFEHGERSMLMLDGSAPPAN